MHEVPSLATYNFKLPLGGGRVMPSDPPWVGLPLQALLYAVYYASWAAYEILIYLKTLNEIKFVNCLNYV